MSKSYTGDIKGVHLSNFVKFVIPKRKIREDEWGLGTCIAGYSPQAHCEASVFKALSTALMLHDNYMCAACDPESDYMDEAPATSYLLSFLNLETQGGSFGSSIYTLPLLIAPDTVVTYKEKRGDYPDTVTYRAGTRGLFCKAAMVIKASTEMEMDMQGTMIHEMGHALMSMIPDLPARMYGHSRESVIEECCMHILTDHRSILSRFGSIDFGVTATQCKSNTVSYDECTVNIQMPTKAVLDGTDLIAREITLTNSDHEPLKTKHGEISAYYHKLANNISHHISRDILLQGGAK